MEFAAWAVIGGGLVINYFAFRARAGTLTRQSFVGIRTRTTMASDEAWRAAHDVAWPWMAVGAWIMAISGVVPLMLESPTEAAFATVLLGGLVAAGIPFAIGFSKAQNAARVVLEGEAG